ncbi:MAG: hypothetical protein ACFUZC_19140 [Chthoniobacteraceae bacterium]
MNLAPLIDYPTPEYPTQPSAKADPALLRSVPRRWKGNRAVLTALATALALAQQGCSQRPHSIPLAGTPHVEDLVTEKEVQAPRHAGPKASPSPKPSSDQLIPLVPGEPAPPRLNTEAEAATSPRPIPTPEPK